ncbi:restriction endonuclease subunit S [Lachnospiraceae bacterium SGI.185]
MKFKHYYIAELLSEISMGPFGSNIKKECFVDSGIPVLNGSNLTDVAMNDDAFRYVTKEKADSLGRANAQRGDVVVTHRGTLGQISFIPKDSMYDRYVISQSQFRFRCNEKVIPEYLVYYFHTRKGQHDLLSNASQVGVPALARATTTFQQLEIDLPEIEEQRKIVEILEDIRRKIELNKEINNNLYEQMLSIFKNARRTSAWNKHKLSDVLIFFDNLRKPLSSIQREKMAHIYPYYGAASIVDYVEDYLFDGTYILISEDGANVIDSFGHPLTQYTYGKFWVNNHAHIVKGSNGYSEALVYSMLGTLNMQSIVTGAAQPKINQANLRNFEAVLPESEEAQLLSELLNPMLQQMLHHDQENEKLSELRDILLSQLMSGSLDVSAIDL